MPDIFLKAAVHTERWLKDREEKEKRRKEASFEEDEEDEDEDKPKKKGAKEEVSKKDKKGDKAKALTYLKQNIRKITGKDDFKDRIKVFAKHLALVSSEPSVHNSGKFPDSQNSQNCHTQGSLGAGRAGQR